jgi:hypothetical protein
MGKQLKTSYENLEEFYKEVVGDNQSVVEVEGYLKDGFDYHGMYCLLGTLSHETRDGIYDNLPFTVAEYKHATDTDMDHGALTDTYILTVGERFYSVDLHFYGQMDFDENETKYEEVTEVFPRTISQVIYTREKES